MRPVAVVLTILLAACSTTLDPLPRDELGSRLLEIRRDPAFLPFRYHSGVKQPGTVVIRDAQAWQGAWIAVTAGHSPRPQLPAVDFGKEMVILVALGARPSGGHSAEILRVVQSAGGISVDYVDRSPSSGCITTAAITHPIDLVIVPRVDGAAEFAKREQVMTC